MCVFQNTLYYPQSCSHENLSPVCVCLCLCSSAPTRSLKSELERVLSEKKTIEFQVQSLESNLADAQSHQASLAAENDALKTQVNDLNQRARRKSSSTNSPRHPDSAAFEVRCSVDPFDSFRG